MKQKSVATQERPFYLLEFFSLQTPTWGLSELASASGLPKASCLRALRVLERYSFVVKDEARYRLGPRLISLGSLVQESYPPRRVVRPELERLRDTVHQSVQWVVRDGVEGVYVEVVEALERVRLFIAPGRRAPLYAGGSTRLLLTFAPPEVQTRVLAAKRERITSKTPVAAKTLQSRLRLSRQTWFAASFGELEPHSAELAAPVFGAHAQPLGVISVAGAGAHYRDLDVLRGYLNALNASAEAASRMLGFSAEWQADPDTFLGAIEARVDRLAL